MFKPKIRVETITAGGMTAKKRVIRGNQVIIRKKQETVEEYAPNFDHTCIVNYHTGIWPFRRHKQKLLLMQDADRCISFHFSLPKEDIPQWDRQAEENLFKANVIKASGHTHQTLKLPMLFYILLTMILSFTLLNFLQSAGVVRF